MVNNEEEIEEEQEEEETEEEQEEEETEEEQEEEETEEEQEEKRTDEEEHTEEARTEEKERVKEGLIEEAQIQEREKNEEEKQIQADNQQLNKLKELLKEKDLAIKEITDKKNALENQISLLKQEVQQLKSQKTQPAPSPKPSEKPSKPAELPKLMETPKPIETTSGEKGKFSCPKCNSTRVVEETDKSKVIYMAASTPIYAKKKRCLKCNYSWAV